MCKKQLRKTCSLESSPEMVAFIKGQSNFSRSVQALILQCVFEHQGEIIDVDKEREGKVNRIIYPPRHPITEQEAPSSSTIQEESVQSSVALTVQGRHIPADDREPIGFRTHMAQSAFSHETPMVSKPVAAPTLQPSKTAFYLDENDIPNGYDI